MTQIVPKVTQNRDLGSLDQNQIRYLFSQFNYMWSGMPKHVQSDTNSE